jgi:hypothetical protein
MTGRTEGAGRDRRDRYPARLTDARVIPLVDYTARALGRMLEG